MNPLHMSVDISLRGLERHISAWIEDHAGELRKRVDQALEPLFTEQTFLEMVDAKVRNAVERMVSTEIAQTVMQVSGRMTQERIRKVTMAAHADVLRSAGFEVVEPKGWSDWC